MIGHVEPREATKQHVATRNTTRSDGRLWGTPVGHERLWEASWGYEGAWEAMGWRGRLWETGPLYPQGYRRIVQVPRIPPKHWGLGGWDFIAFHPQVERGWDGMRGVNERHRKARRPTSVAPRLGGLAPLGVRWG